MKELTKEEKAIAYDKALEKAKDFYKGYKQRDNQLYADDLETIFPELKGNMYRTNGDYDLLNKQIAWLEKQGELPVSININKMVDYYANNNEPGNKEFGKPINCMIRAYRQGLTDAISTLNLKNQGEQKATDKVEPKFKVGDWIINSESGYIRQILKINNCCYETDYGVLPIKDYESVFRLWTIQDAKAGDVLAFSFASQNYILIYKGLYEKSFKTIMSVFCFYSVEEDAYYDETDSFHIMNRGEIITLATKEQRDTLFAKMREAGYTFDFDKKELKEIKTIK